MTPLDRQRLMSALMLLVIALFVSGGYPPAARWRRELRWAALVAFAVAAALALVEVWRWLWSGTA